MATQNDLPIAVIGAGPVIWRPPFISWPGACR